MPTAKHVEAQLALLRSEVAQLQTARARVRPPPWGVEWGRKYLPKYFAVEPADFHQELFDQTRTLHLTRDTKLAIIAPRDGAKSTLLTFAYAMYCAVSKVEPYIVILSDSAPQAAEKLRAMRRQFEKNAALAADYPGACGIGPQWRNDLIELRNGVVIRSAGRRMPIRGTKNEEARPTLVIFDDVEKRSDMRSKTEKNSAWEWATMEVIPAGDNKTNFLSVGSALHRQCVAVRLGQLAGWQSKTHKAVHAWPERMDLWEQWERLATNPADPNRNDTAKEFYEMNRREMLEGAVVYWAARWPLYDLMKRRAEIGPAAFDCEYQGVPSTEGMTTFPAEYFESPEIWFSEFPARLALRVQALDPSKGADSDAGDYQAHVNLAMDGRGALWVDADLRREPIPAMITRALDRAQWFAPLDSFAVEDNDALGMLVDEFDRQLRESGILLPWCAVHQSSNKEERIRRLDVYLARKQIRFRNTKGTRLLVDQLRDHPLADHDDAPDALELAIRRLEYLTKTRK